MKTLRSDTSLALQFASGTTPKQLDGFYQGKLIKLLPKNVLESFGSMILQVWLPWYGKEFAGQENKGSNRLPKYLLSFFKSFYGDSIILKIDKQSINVFPFRTMITTGLQDKMKVLQLTYDLPQNPSRVRQVIDELVCIEKDTYLGKAYLKEGNKQRIVAYFTLTK